MITYPFLGAIATVFVVIGVLASLVAVGVLTNFFVTQRRDRLARHETLRTHYRRLVFTP